MDYFIYWIWTILDMDYTTLYTGLLYWDYFIYGWTTILDNTTLYTGYGLLYWIILLYILDMDYYIG